MNKLSKEKKDQLILTGLITLIAIVALVYGLMGFQRGKLRATKEKTVELQEQLDEMNRVLSLRAPIAKNLSETQTQLDAIESELAPQINQLAWIRQTMTEFQEAHPKIRISNYITPTLGEIGILASFPYKAVICPIQGTATYHDYGSFLADFENKFPYYIARGMLLEPEGSTDEQQSENLRFRVSLVALVKPQPLPEL